MILHITIINITFFPESKAGTALTDMIMIIIIIGADLGGEGGEAAAGGVPARVLVPLLPHAP
jgi:hypothetical protein